MAPFIMNPFRFGGGGAVGGWKELDRTTLSGSGSTIDVTGLDDKQYYMVLRNILTATADVRENFNSDTGNNYSRRYSANGGSDVTSINNDHIGLNYSAGDKFLVDYVSNLSTVEKLVLSHSSEEGSAGASNPPNRMEVVGKWANTSNAIDEINTSLGGGSYDTGSEVVVLGYDASDTHSDADNFWQELTSVDWSSGNSITTSTFTPKKYIWYQGWWKTGASMSGAYSALQVGNSTIDTGSNYSERYSVNGSADSTETSVSNMYGLVGQGNSASNVINFTNGFIVNNASNEKLFIADSTFGLDGASNVNGRSEAVGKWANTSNQIDIIKLLTPAGSGNWIAGQVKVWGHD